MLLSLYQRIRKNRKDAAVIIAPGGGFRFLSWNKEGTEIAKWLNSLGISAFVLKYRVPCNTMETAMKALIDSQRAISLVRSKNLGFKKIGFAGFSAGGFLAASVSSFPMKVYAPVDEVDKESGAVDFAVLVYAAGKDGTAMPAQAPATFIAIAKDDPCVKVDMAEEYYGKLRKYSPEHELHVFGGGHHGYGDCQLYVTGNEWQPVCAWTLDAQLFMEHQIGVKRGLGALKYSDNTASSTSSDESSDEKSSCRYCAVAYFHLAALAILLTQTM